MGGTSTDVVVDRAQRPSMTDEGSIGPYPVAVPMADIHTIGAGGGSIAYLDAAGALHVGPRIGRCESRTGLLRPRRHRTDRDGRERRARTYPVDVATGRIAWICTRTARERAVARIAAAATHVAGGSRRGRRRDRERAHGAGPARDFTRTRSRSASICARVRSAAPAGLHVCALRRRPGDPAASSCRCTPACSRRSGCWWPTRRGADQDGQSRLDEMAGAPRSPRSSTLWPTSRQLGVEADDGATGEAIEQRRIAGSAVSRPELHADGRLDHARRCRSRVPRDARNALWPRVRIFRSSWSTSAAM